MKRVKSTKSGEFLTEIILTGGREVEVGIRHGRKSARELGVESFSFDRETPLRYTEVFVRDVARDIKVSARSVCSPRDNFCKKTGRRMAAIRLLDKLKNPLGNGYLWFPKKEDRAQIFKAICPDY